MILCKKKEKVFLLDIEDRYSKSGEKRRKAAKSGEKRRKAAKSGEKRRNCGEIAAKLRRNCGHQKCLIVIKYSQKNYIADKKADKIMTNFIYSLFLIINERN